MRYPNPNMLLRIAQADAYCAATEFIKPEHNFIKQEALKFEKYLKHPNHSLKAGKYTDDTQMSIAVSEVLLKDDFANTELNFANSFVNVFHRDQRDGYARNFQKFLETTHSGYDFLAKIKPDSDKNGAAMRSVPIGVLPSEKDVIHIAGLQARITHCTAGGVGSSVAVALMSHFSLWKEGPLSDLPKWLQQYFLVDLEPWKEGPVIGPDLGMKTARAVLTLISEEKSLLGILRKTIEWGGDTDSVAAIAWGIASARMIEELPDFFEYCLEPGSLYGVSFLKDLGKQLMEKYSDD